jgi:ankyrin repeat protein
LTSVLIGSSAPDSGLVDAIRRNDAAAVTKLAASSTNLNAHDDTGATPLMYAALYASADVMKILIAHGADVDAPNNNESTALMWAAYDTEKTRVLLDNGAMVNAVAKDRSSALSVAVRSNNLNSLRLLLTHGADFKQVAAGPLLRTTFDHEDGEAVRQELAKAGMPVNDRDQLHTIFSAVDSFSTERQLIKAGVSTDGNLKFATVDIPPLNLFSFAGETETMKLLLDRGSDVNATTSHAATPLMMLAGAPHSSSRTAQLLISKGANIQARDDRGRTALDWAVITGNTPVAEVLRKAGASAAESAPEPTYAAKPRAPREAIQLALNKLLPASPVFSDHTKCVSCHNNSLPEMAAQLAISHGIAIDHAAAAQPAEATLSAWGKLRENTLLLRGVKDAGSVAQSSYGLVALAQDGIPHNLTTDAYAVMLAASQRSDGSWNLDDIRPPISDRGPIHWTALSMKAIQSYLPTGRSVELKARVARATTFIRQTKADCTQEQAFKVLGLVWAGAGKNEIRSEAQRLIGLQRKDGGWSQGPAMESDAYATGQALYALKTAQIAPSTETFRRGITFLLRTQLEDGTWFVRSRAFPIQQYFETGFPHGRDQFISAAATAWASIGLAESLP